MNAKQKLLAAAEKIEGAMRPERDCGLPWIRDDLSIVTSADRDLVVSEDFYGPDADLIVLAVNAMPALAAWLHWEAECACVPEHSYKALAVADQILGEQ